MLHAHLYIHPSQLKRSVRDLLELPDLPVGLDHHSSAVIQPAHHFSAAYAVCLSMGPRRGGTARGKQGWAAQVRITQCCGLWNVECGLNHSAVPRGENSRSGGSRDSSRGTEMPDPSRSIDAWAATLQPTRKRRRSEHNAAASEHAQLTFRHRGTQFGKTELKSRSDGRWQSGHRAVASDRRFRVA